MAHLESVTTQKNISVKCKILLKNILSFLDKIFKIYVETTHCKCGVFLPKWDNKFLEDLSRSIQGNRHIALLTDNAGWHTAKKLTVPSNITLIPLPPYAPELNAMEQVWEWIKNHYLSNQCYGVYEDIVTMACYAWNQLAHNVDLVKSIMYRDWINTPC
ncbi:transposase [Candidatus Tisiphia endosymbiont of Parasteatoda lunata]|uniref:transposase n=1 Tax=Candidatus Tisiphia endosymbiont of Parasteatoda lunata TaxID=3066275 RepID=UPI00313E600C